MAPTNTRTWVFLRILQGLHAPSMGQYPANEIAFRGAVQAAACDWCAIRKSNGDWQEELDRLYPKGLKLQLVQVLLRHGERSPVTTRFRNAGLPAYWPYCNAAQRLSSVSMSDPDRPAWEYLQWRRRIESFSADDSPHVVRGPGGELDGICQLGELTDTGRRTTLALGQRLRHLYVNQLGFMPKLIKDADMIYLRATPMPRALESVQQAFWGLYPINARTASFAPPTIITRAPTEETLFPNERNCRRFSLLSRAFAQRAAERWNSSKEMDYINKRIGKWMPSDSPRVAVDSHPRLSGVMDTVNATLAHGDATRLPEEFYDPQVRKFIDAVAVDEWFAGYQESNEYRQVGIGGLVGDIVERMVGSVERSGNGGMEEVRASASKTGTSRGSDQGIMFALSGCHDTTLAAILSSFGCFKGEQWPPYTSHIAIELFRSANVDQNQLDSAKGSSISGESLSLWSYMFGETKNGVGSSHLSSQGIARKGVDQLTSAEKKSLDGYFVRVRYNDRPMTIPGCRVSGNHLEGDESFCTLNAFKAIADKFTPRNWKKTCETNLDQPAIPKQIEEPGY